MAIPNKIADRLSFGLKRFQPIISAAKARDANESDTSMIVTDMMAELFGYDKYSEVTKELAIRGTYCDLATKIEGKFQMLIEVKAVGIDLKDSHIKQAVDYASNKGIEWVALTNANNWKVFKVIFSKPIDFEMVLDIDLLTLNFKNETHLENLFLLTKESMIKSGLYAYHDQIQATNKFYLGALILSDTVLQAIRKELRRITPDVKVPIDDLRNVLIQDVLKREVIEGEKADIAKKKVQKVARKLLRTKKENSAEETSPELLSSESESSEASSHKNTNEG
ncbi:MAG: type I restriction enzyme HsdR N-terminal domain-containing protein [Thermodesulfovibrionales bacterium]|nr:type I restriction enzyme HsdR N-terminal domain-containing protein [Thermodesulfovibrionales bacterium]